MRKMLAIVFVMVVVLAAVSITTEVKAKEGVILQGEFAGLLFDRLELVEQDVILTRAQKIKALEDLKFAPDEGYADREPLAMKQLVVVLVRIYSLEGNLPDHYTEEDAFKVLIEKKILKEEDKLEVYVLYIRAVSLIADIQPIPGQKPGLVLLPRVPVGPPASPVD